MYCYPAMANHGPEASGRRSGRPGPQAPHDGGGQVTLIAGSVIAGVRFRTTTGRAVPSYRPPGRYRKTTIHRVPPAQLARRIGDAVRVLAVAKDPDAVAAGDGRRDEGQAGFLDDVAGEHVRGHVRNGDEGM